LAAPWNQKHPGNNIQGVLGSQITSKGFLEANGQEIPNAGFLIRQKIQHLIPVQISKKETPLKITPRRR
jgi:hypothetical protein